MYKIVLASNSPRRKEILENLGVQFQIITSDIEEKLNQDMDPYHLATELAYQKAKNVADKINDKVIVIGADTVVVNNQILGKPQDQLEAFRMLKQLSGNQHEVVTGLALIDCHTKKEIRDYEITKVCFRQLEDIEINQYIATGEPMDKAGGYGIQGKASLFVRKIDGDYYNVVGLPIYKLGEMLNHYFNIHLLKYLS
ncbi:Maf family protein [Natronincola ferrireducens]|uniref:dTTP/UTP pyrophosphatase n=1 Tax=Natronincola ferrireducens TaxID=393762 RepID=A0A1G9D3Y3_9FIRM|nr:Maf family protein [Natronincola ferrireducens]SDK58394.1 septum formation protein [Natronincola ferrireducens]